MVLFCGANLSAKSFDWSKCWCNYGAGIKEGDFIVNVDGGLWYSDFGYSVHDGFWFIPPVMAEVQYAMKIWELPFTFGGYAGMRGYGYSYKNAENEDVSAKYFGVFFGGEASYHIQLPLQIQNSFQVHLTFQILLLQIHKIKALREPLSARFPYPTRPAPERPGLLS